MIVGEFGILVIIEGQKLGVDCSQRRVFACVELLLILMTMIVGVSGIAVEVACTFSLLLMMVMMICVAILLTLLLYRCEIV